MSRVLLCDGCGAGSIDQSPVLPFRDSELDYCAPCMKDALAFYMEAVDSREKHVTAWRDELVELRALHAPALKTVPIPQGPAD